METCKDRSGDLAAAVYGDLDSAARERLDAHLASCAACRREIDELRSVARSLGSGPLDVAPPEEARLLKSLAARTLPPRRARVRNRLWPTSAAVAAAAALVVVAFAALNRPVREPQGPLAKQTPAPLPAPVRVPPPHPSAPVPVPAPRPAPLTEPSVPPIPTPVRPPLPAPPLPGTPKEDPPAIEPPAPPAPKPGTVAVIARLDAVHGQVSLDGAPAAAGAGLIPGAMIRTQGRSSAATIAYPDGTRIDLGPDSSLRESSADAKGLLLERGSLRAEVAKQPAGRPLILKTRDAEATVLGTTLLLDADRGRLEVHEGRVKLARAADGASVELGAGRRADLATLTPRPLHATLDLVALWTFEEGVGNRILDRSGAGVPLDLALRNPGAAEWRPDGLHVRAHPRLMTEVPAAKLTAACRASQELTLEAWIVPDRAVRDFDGVLVALSRDNADRNAALAQVRGQYEASLRLSTSDAAGRPVLETPSTQAAPRLTQLVFTRAANGAERFYVDGVLRASRSRPGDFSTWAPDFKITVGDELTEERPWEGVLRRVAVYSRALGPAEILRHHRLGGAP